MDPNWVCICVQGMIGAPGMNGSDGDIGESGETGDMGRKGIPGIKVSSLKMDIIVGAVVAWPVHVYLVRCGIHV